MTTFASLSCQRCGARLKPSANPSVYKCEHCGQEYLYASNTSASAGGYAACPVCGRNDRAEKVSAIITGQTQHLSGTTLQTTSYQDNKGNWVTTTSPAPFSGTQVSALARALSRPTAPQAPSKTTIYFYRFCEVFYAGAFVLTLLWLIADLSRPEGTPGLAAAVCAAAGVFIFVFERDIRKRSRAYDAAKQQFPAETARWQRACKVWDQMYYCARDDVVFLPGTRLSAPSGQAQDFVYRV